MINNEAWAAKAVCRDHNPDLWFPGRYESHLPAAKICFTCPVIGECRQLADQSGQEHGVWGGRYYGTPRALMYGTNTA